VSERQPMRNVPGEKTSPADVA